VLSSPGSRKKRRRAFSRVFWRKKRNRMRSLLSRRKKRKRAPTPEGPSSERRVFFLKGEEADDRARARKREGREGGEKKEPWAAASLGGRHGKECIGHSLKKKKCRIHYLRERKGRGKKAEPRLSLLEPHGKGKKNTALFPQDVPAAHIAKKEGKKSPME